MTNEGLNALNGGLQSTSSILTQQSTTVDHISAQLTELTTFERTEHALSRNLFSSAATGYNDLLELSFLESLRFATIGDRRAAVAEAHQQTFEWIFETESRSTGPPEATFSDWLQTDTTFYWIQGKAGSGKSTLLRFLLYHPKVVEHLCTWSQNKNCIRSAFFFWKSGTEEQRSIVGLLRSLLWEVLSCQPSLVPRIFPEDWARLCTLREHGLPLSFDIWTIPRLKLAFQRLISQTSKDLKLCFFINGVDELGDDQSDISNILSFFRGFESSPFVKFCISSRPWPVFIRFFEHFPSLRLQDLTKGDIELYVEDKLKKNELMLESFQQEPKMAASITESIVEKADGVFLWVRLVVKSLLNGLMNGDDISDLQRRLARIPPDLESLYAPMLAGIDEVYMEETSKIFQLLIASLKRSRYLSVQMLDMAMRFKVDEPLQEGYRYLSQTNTKSDAYLKQQAKRLHARSGGLLEVRERTGSRFSGNGMEVPTNEVAVQYLHRTVADFITSPQIWEKLLSFTTACSFDTSKLLLKSLFLDLDKNRTKQSIPTHWRNAISFVHGEPENENTTRVTMLDELDNLLTQYEAILDSQSRISSTKHWSRHFFPTTWYTDMLSMAIYEGCYTYVETKLALNNALAHETRQPHLLFFALKWIAMRETEVLNIMVEILLKNGANPNELYLKHTLWQYTIHYAHTRGDGFHSYSWEKTRPQWYKIFKLMLEHGADLNASCFKDSNAWVDLYKDFEDPQDDIMKFLQRATTHYSIFSGDFSSVEPSPQQLQRHTLSAVVLDMFGDSSGNPTSEATELLVLMEGLKDGQ